MLRQICAVSLIVFSVTAARLFAQSPNLAAQAARARDLMAAGRYDAAIPIYRDLVRALPSNPGLLSNLGIALHMAGDEREAVAAFKKALALNPSDAPASLYLGYAYLSLGEPEYAIMPLETALRAQPGDSGARESLGKALLATRHYRRAAAQFRDLSGSDPSSAAAWYGLGLSYQARAQQSYEELQNRAPGSAYWLALAAGARAKAMQYSSAFYLYRQALEKMPSLRGAHAALAAIYRKTGHDKWAAEEAAKEKKLGRLDCTGHPLACEYTAGRYTAVASSQSGTAEALYWKTQAFNQLAVSAFSHLGALPNSAEYHELLATIHASGGDAAGAAAEWEKAHALAPHDLEITEQLARALIATKSFTRAMPLVEQLRRREPDSPQINYLLGNLLLSQQKPGQAIRPLALAVRRDPKLLRAQSALAKAYIDAGQTASAIPHLRAALPLDSDGSLHYQLARAYAAAGQRDLAQQMLKSYQEIHTAYEKQAQELKQQVRVTAPSLQ